MKKLNIFAIAMMATAAAAAQNADGVVILDLSKSTTPLEFNQQTGAWDKTFSEDELIIESQCFAFIHGAIEDYDTWWGFTASNSADNSPRDNYITYQYSNMAEGGIALDGNGAIKFNEAGAPEVSADMPYLVAYYSPYSAQRPVDMVFNDGKDYDPVGVYVNLNTYVYNSVTFGDAFSRRFTQGDKFTLTVHGVAPDETEKTVEVSLASVNNGCITIASGWMYVDLTSLGTVNELYFTLDSTDTGAWGMNTPGYFCLDKLMVKPAEGASVEALRTQRAALSYDRAAHTVSVAGASFAAVYDTAGHMVMSSTDATFSIDRLGAGVYVVKADDAVLKIAR
ncbi:MAG: DUF4465 domain-containing protein [Muribaculaceae bacterium]|nr:DUF4465 domain-containing protein [Muribaculaceae bacterium]